MAAPVPLSVEVGGLIEPQPKRIRCVTPFHASAKENNQCIKCHASFDFDILHKAKRRRCYGGSATGSSSSIAREEVDDGVVVAFDTQQEDLPCAAGSTAPSPSGDIVAEQHREKKSVYKVVLDPRFAYC